MGKRGTFRIGASGWQYKHWFGLFYPEDVPRRLWLEYYAARFDTVEINNTFYHLPPAETFESWRRRAPRDFLYAVKFSRFGTHMKRLLDPAGTIGLFVERARRLDETLGPILVQLPPRFRVDTERLDRFLAVAPKQYRWVVEFRDQSWLCDQACDVLRRHGTALCLHDKFAHARIVTSDWTYIRYHGGPDGGDYPDDQLDRDAEEIRRWLDARLDVYVYFNNDWHGFALKNACYLRARVLGQPRPDSPLREQLFK